MSKMTGKFMRSTLIEDALMLLDLPVLATEQDGQEASAILIKGTEKSGGLLKKLKVKPRSPWVRAIAVSIRLLNDAASHHTPTGMTNSTNRGDKRRFFWVSKPICKSGISCQQ